MLRKIKPAQTGKPHLRYREGDWNVLASGNDAHDRRATEWIVARRIQSNMAQLLEVFVFAPRDTQPHGCRP